MTWHWSRFKGSADMLRLMRRDLATLKLVVSQVPQRRVAVQAGACLGIFPKYLAERFQSVYTFEPDPENFLTLCYNAPERNIVKLQAALGCTRGGVSISHKRWSEKPGKAHEGIRHVDGPGPIPTLFVDDLHLPICDLLYLDIEGHELYALRGAEQTIRRCQPVIALEINEMVTHIGETAESVYTQMAGFGYRHQGAVSVSDHLFLPATAAMEGAA